MRTDKYMMAKAWMKQDQAPQAEALETWNTLEAEFNEERKAMLMASAETDAIKEAMNKKFGSGTVKYGSEIPQPEMKTPQAIFEFSQRNPAADGGRMRFDDGLSAKMSYNERTKLLDSYHYFFNYIFCVWCYPLFRTEATLKTHHTLFWINIF